MNPYNRHCLVLFCRNIQSFARDDRTVKKDHKYRSVSIFKVAITLRDAALVSVIRLHVVPAPGIVSAVLGVLTIRLCPDRNFIGTPPGLMFAQLTDHQTARSDTSRTRSRAVARTQLRSPLTQAIGQRANRNCAQTRAERPLIAVVVVREEPALEEERIVACDRIAGIENFAWPLRLCFPSKSSVKNFI